MRIIGLDLAIASAHKAVVADATGQFLTSVFPVATWADELGTLLQRARSSATEEALSVVMEPTGLAWLPVSVYLRRQSVTTYVVNSKYVAALRRYYHQMAKSDRIDARVLAKLLVVSPEKLHPLLLPLAPVLTLQRACKQLDWVITPVTALTNQIVAVDRALWLGGWKDLVFSDPFSPAARWCREHFYDPSAVLNAGATVIRQAWRATALDLTDTGAWAEALVELAQQVLAVYGHPSEYVDFAAFQAEVSCKQRWLAGFEADRDDLRLNIVRPLYRHLHPSRNLESLYGVGQDSAAVYISFIGVPRRFATGRVFRGWSGLVPRSAQSAESESKGLKISQAGPDLVKKFAYLDAEVARRYDSQLAKIYYDQMVQHGKHHRQAVVAVATHLLDRIQVIVQEDRPYELRDVDGTPVTPEQAQTILAEKYTVPDEVRRRNNRRTRRARAEAQAERKHRQGRKSNGPATTLVPA